MGAQIARIEYSLAIGLDQQAVGIEPRMIGEVGRNAKWAKAEWDSIVVSSDCSGLRHGPDKWSACSQHDLGPMPHEHRDAVRKQPG